MQVGCDRGSDQSRAPLAEALAAHLDRGIYPFHTPGHKGGAFAPPALAELIGPRAVRFDLPAMTATDNTLHPTTCVKDAQNLAAGLLGARETFFLTNGSSQGVAAAVLACAPPGAVIAMPRNVHRSVGAALVLSGAVPRFIRQRALAECGALAVEVDALIETLEQEPRPAAVLITRPSYYGLAGDLRPLAEACHERGVPLIVDEAHGAHLAFLPSGNLPPALAAGADVAIQSWHKTLGSLVGSAMLHVSRSALVDPQRVRDALNLVQTTSPNYLQLASLDLARQRLAAEGRELFAETAPRVAAIEDRLDALPGVQVIRPERDPRLADHQRDPLRVVVNVAETGWTGFDVEETLRQFQVEDEMADWFNVVLLFSPGDDAAACERLVAAFAHVSANPKLARLIDAATTQQLVQPIIPSAVMTPREAALGPKEDVALSSGMGRAAAEMVMVYPPGIPLLMPGELIQSETVAVCRDLLAAGAHVYATDPQLNTIRVAAV
ncbi:MAG: aminotransferase class I/II-fold pyridoxal phosphate-dependent enzyme [Planctomycetales bacterium]|nr:aminotransferase class I/II-fold pyridoxal phosphate-dependent enzyme [Planctomycetales bacterium]